MIRQIPKNNNLKSLFFSTATNLSSYYFNFSKPPIFPRLPVLDKLTEEINGDKPNLNKYFLIAGQHALETTGSLFEWMINELSLPPNNIFMVGKTYSSSADVIKRLRNELGIRHQTNTPQVTLGGFIDSYDTDITKTWDRFARYIHEKISDGSPISGIFVLDDGGHLFKKIPADIANLTIDGHPVSIIGIEQTISGIRSSSVFPHPIIEVATAAAKKLETTMVAKALQLQIDELFKNYLTSLNIPKLSNPNILSKLNVGIIGLGNIGKAVLSYLQNLGYDNLVVFDRDDFKIGRNINFGMVARSIVELVERSDIIIGCSGHDCMHANFAECLKAINSTDRKNIPKIFISVSSKDIEFNSLLVHIQSNNRNGPINPLDNILYPKTNPKVIILGGGMPLNFLPVNKGISNHSIPLEDIQLTRGLLASAILQAYYMMENGNTNIAQQYQLDPYRQHFIVKSWCESNKKPMIKDFDSIDWIKKYSGNGKHWCQNKCSSLVPFKPNFI